MPAALARECGTPRQQECIKEAQGGGGRRGSGQVRCCMGITIPPFLAYSTTFGVFTEILGRGILNRR
ncbi:MAG: hypothetical protein HF975_14430 [ANME-2 cluster archaeon]|nr:hypothetical protein [ANME-2 cluster archaeon]MBC2748166.1 hypothetical protein [ANME-2 cluster archaeon]